MGFKSPFVDEITRNNKRKFKIPSLDTFDGSEDPPESCEEIIEPRWSCTRLQKSKCA